MVTVLGGGPPQWEWCPYQKNKRPGVTPIREDLEEAAVCKPGRGSSLDPKSAGSSILDVQRPDQEN